MFPLRSYILPVVVSIALHALLIIVVMFVKPAKEATSTPKVPTYVNAKLVELKAKTNKQPKKVNKPKKVDLTKQRKEQERKKREAEQKRKRAIEKKKKEEAAKKRKAEELKKKKAAEAAAKRKKEEARKKAQEKEAARKREEQRMAQEMEDEFKRAMAEEEQMLEAEAQEMEASSYMAVIRDRIEQRWSRPPSARKGMQCTLNIKLVPTGKVISVTVAKSSGHDAFDRSAMQAVRAVEQFHELKGLEPALFEKYFRDITLIFNPEDRRL